MAYLPPRAQRNTAVLAALPVGLALCAVPVATSAATISPPMHDIAAQCGASARRNVTAMSECIVAESEARAEVLSRWDRLSDASAEKCLKLGAKSKTNKKYPYSTLAKCVAVEPLEVRTEGGPVAPASEAPTGAVSPPGRSMLPSWVPKWTGFQKSDATPTR